MIDLLEVPDFFDDMTRTEILSELQRCAGQAATVLDNDTGRVQPNVRRTTRLQPPPGIRELILGQLHSLRPRLEQHFDVTLGECEEPQFLRYLTGDFFVPHQDGNTPMLYDESRFRRVSTVIFLSRQASEPGQDSYGGGSLVMHGSFSNPAVRVPVNMTPGTLVAFRPETTHEVTPVTHGERYTIACWFRAPL